MIPRNVPINTVSWLCTHNAFNSEAEIKAGSHEAGGTNQNHSIVEQLDAGVRALMIDVHEDAGRPRVRHVGAIADHNLNYEDLCELLVHLKGWLVHHTTEVVLLLMEVDAAPELIRDTFAGAGPVKPAPCQTNYDLRDLLYEHTSVPWPSIDGLVAAGKRLVVFRETDDGKGKTTTARSQIGGREANLKFYHDMWEHWLETPYSNSWAWDWINARKKYWGDLQTNTYILSPVARGNPATATFFNLNHFVDTGTYAAGSAGAAEGINQKTYLKARALIAWKMQGRRPTLSVNFFKSVAGQAMPYNTVDTANELNDLPAISGNIILQPSLKPLDREVYWEGVAQLKFSDHLGNQYLDWNIDDNAVSIGTPTSRLGTYCFPCNTDGAPMTLIPRCPGYDFDPPSVTWDGSKPATQNFMASISKYASQDVLRLAGILDTPVYLHPSANLEQYWEVENDSPDEGTPLQIWSRTGSLNNCQWTIRFADTLHGHDRFEIHNPALNRYATVLYPWGDTPRPPVAGQRVRSYAQKPLPRHTQRFYVQVGPNHTWVFVSSDVAGVGGEDWAVVTEGGNLGNSTKLVLGALKGAATAGFCVAAPQRARA